jgi:formate dehydrogenase maturation protein FdhE
MTAEPVGGFNLTIHQEAQKIKSAFQAQYSRHVEIFDSEVEERRRENRHLLDIRKLKSEDTILNPLSIDLLSIPLLHEAFNQEDIQKFSDDLEEIGSSRLLDLFLHKDWQTLESLAVKHGIEQDLLLFVGLNLTQAVLELYAEKLKSKVDQENWLKGICPVCGNLPALGKLRKEDGKRILWCAWCGTEWHYKRIMCPFCGNEDHNSLRFFLVEGDPPADKAAFRVDVCDKCKRYIKTLDERKFPHRDILNLRMENSNTLYLDVLARKDGYKSPTFWMAALSGEELVC